ncbi:hypothetical protein BH18ACI4_BH18ACI4_18870 [soil metagenome]
MVGNGNDPRNDTKYHEFKATYFVQFCVVSWIVFVYLKGFC